VLFYYALSAGFGLLGISGASPALKLGALLVLLGIGAATILFAARRARSQPQDAR